MAKVARKSPRNYEIAKGIMRWTRSAAYAKKGLYKIKDKKVPTVSLLFLHLLCSYKFNIIF